MNAKNTNKKNTKKNEKRITKKKKKTEPSDIKYRDESSCNK